MSQEIATTVKLQNPVTIGKEGGEEFSEIKFRKPKAKDMMQFTIPVPDENGRIQMEMGGVLAVAKKICMCPAKVIDELDAEDAYAVFGAVGELLGNGSGDGKKPS